MNEEVCRQLELTWNNQLQFDAWQQRRETDWKRLIEEQLPELGKTITTDGGLFTYLESKRVFDRRTMETIKRQTGTYAQVSTMLQALSKHPFTNFILFCESLIQSNQTHVVNKFLTPEVSWTDDSKQHPSGDHTASEDSAVGAGAAEQAAEFVDYDWRACIRHSFDRLVEEIDPDGGLLNELLSRGVVDKIVTDVIQSRKGRANRVVACIDHLTKFRPDSDFVKFCRALEATNQTHIVASYLSRNSLDSAAAFDGSNVPSVAGSSQSETEERRQVELEVNELNAWLATEHRQLCSDWKTTLINVRSDVADQIDMSEEFVNLLVKYGIMNFAIGERCREEEDVVARTDYVLDHMNRRSSGDFSMFCQALHQTRQGHIVRDYLSTGTGRGDVPDTPIVAYQATD